MFQAKEKFEPVESSRHWSSSILSDDGDEGLEKLRIKAELGSFFVPRYFPPGSTIYSPGDIDEDGAYIIVSGHVSLINVNQDGQGGDVLLGLLGPGSVFGLISIVHNCLRLVI
jgi:CRP-like cAMP-binding protein